MNLEFYFTEEEMKDFLGNKNYLCNTFEVETHDRSIEKDIKHKILCAYQNENLNELKQFVKIKEPSDVEKEYGLKNVFENVINNILKNKILNL